MQGELLTRCLLHLHGILRSRGLGLLGLRFLGRFLGRHNVVGVGDKRREEEKLLAWKGEPWMFATMRASKAYHSWADCCC